MNQVERCPGCGTTDFAVARDMIATRHCKCGRTWVPMPKDQKAVDWRLLDYYEKQVVDLRKALTQWALVKEMPEWVHKIVLDADAVQNEIDKIKTGRVK